MAPSPPDALIPSSIQDYSDSWRAIMHLVRSGYSWSGNERNCVFLNCTGSGATSEMTPHFANASAISGLDFPDDGRALAVVDWDLDGDLDLWFRNRTAPRLRLLRNLSNEISPQDRHISLHLIGTTCNRDAIGARAELVLHASDGKAFRLVRSVRAGDAFLSQSSKWLHFGLAQDATIAQLIVTWPGGTRETFDALSVGRSYEITQGAGKPVALTSRSPVTLTARRYEPLPETASARIILPGRVALPRLMLQFDDAPEAAPGEFGGTPTLVTFWTSSCPNCRQELAELAQHHAAFTAANLNVVAICLDGWNKTDVLKSAEANEAKSFLRTIKFPFRTALAAQETVELVGHFQNALFDKYPNFVVPLSFLVDSQTQVVSIYRGAFSHETFLRDRALIGLNDQQLRSQAAAWLGTWITEPVTRAQFTEFVGGRMLAHAPHAALRYYELAARYETDAEARKASRQRIDAIKQTIDRQGTK